MIYYCMQKVVVKLFDAVKLNDCTQSDSHAHVYVMK